MVMWWLVLPRDALLPPPARGDLGSNFGVDRPDTKGASGVRILSEAAAIVRAAGFEIGNVSVQLVGNRPKFSRAVMRRTAC